MTQAADVESNGASGAHPSGMTDAATSRSQTPTRVVETIPVEIEGPITRHDLAVIQFFNRVDRLFTDQVDVREREIAAKDRLISELERRAQQAEEHASLLHEYIKNLAPGSEYQSRGDPLGEAKADKSRWRFWR